MAGMAAMADQNRRKESPIKSEKKCAAEVATFGEREKWTKGENDYQVAV